MKEPESAFLTQEQLRVKRNDDWRAKELRRMELSLTRLTNEEALRMFEWLCCGRLWTREEANQIRYMVEITC